MSDVDPNEAQQLQQHDEEPEDYEDAAEEEAAPVFALSPALIDGVIDMSTRHGQRIFEANSAPIENIEFDCSSELLSVFLTAVHNRAEKAGYRHILEISKTDDPLDVNNLAYLPEHYGEVSLSQVRRNARTYLGHQSRAAQDSFMLYNCIYSSLTKEGIRKVNLKKEQYTINNQVDGPCLLKTIIMVSHIDTNATTKMLKDKLHDLPEYMRQIKSNIELFNQHVEIIVDMLAARGEETSDLLTYLFNGYKACTDQVFNRYIERREGDYEDGEDIDPKTLMSVCLNKYKTRKDKGLWNALSKEQEQIIALNTRIKSFENNRRKQVIPKNDKDPLKQKPPFEKERKPDWCYVKPKEGETNYKKVDNKEWWFCPTHGEWCRHKPTACRKKKRLDALKKKNEPRNKREHENSDSAPHLRLTQALANLAEVAVEGEDDE